MQAAGSCSALDLAKAAEHQPQNCLAHLPVALMAATNTRPEACKVCMNTPLQAVQGQSSVSVDCL